MTLQLNTEQTVVKEDSRQDAWEVIFLLHIIDYGENMLNVYIASGVACAASVLHLRAAQ